MPKRKKGGKGAYGKPGGRALERLRQFETERGLAPEPVEPGPLEPASAKKKTNTKTTTPKSRD
jgi:hypothetical protein